MSPVCPAPPWVTGAFLPPPVLAPAQTKANATDKLIWPPSPVRTSLLFPVPHKGGTGLADFHFYKGQSLTTRVTRCLILPGAVPFCACANSGFFYPQKYLRWDKRLCGHPTSNQFQKKFSICPWASLSLLIHPTQQLTCRNSSKFRWNIRIRAML